MRSLFGTSPAIWAAVRPLQRVGEPGRVGVRRELEDAPDEAGAVEAGLDLLVLAAPDVRVADQRDGGAEDLLLQRRERRDREARADPLTYCTPSAASAAATGLSEGPGVGVSRPSESTRAAENAASARVAGCGGCSSRLSWLGGRSLRRPSMRATTSVPKRLGGSRPALRATAANCAATGCRPSAWTIAASRLAIETLAPAHGGRAHRRVADRGQHPREVAGGQRVVRAERRRRRRERGRGS